MGLTSKGVFLLFDKRSIFLTYSDHDSPFTIVLPPESLVPANISAGDIVYFSLEELLFPARDLSISLEEIPVWVPDRPHNLTNDKATQETRLQQMLEELLKISPGKGWAFLHQPDQNDLPEQIKIRNAARGFAESFLAFHLPGCLKAANDLIGLGSGLTPSGDDWLTGYILFNVRKSQAEQQPLASFIANLGNELISLAYQKTTWVSANRMEAALHGWSEGLFLNTIDHILSSSIQDVPAHIRALYHYGHSSGVDTFSGIASAWKALVK